MPSGVHKQRGKMLGEKKKYAEDDLICLECIKDHQLREIIKSAGNNETCALCGNKNVGVTIRELAKIVDPVIREYFVQGEIEVQYEIDNDSHWDEQLGEDLSYVLQEVLGQSLDCEDALIDSLENMDPYDPRDGGEPFYERSANYQELSVSIDHLYEDWDAISNELKSHRRFFSDTARKFFECLFEGL